jgi:hypothetical protein
VDLPHGGKGIGSAIGNRDFETSPLQHLTQEDAEIRIIIDD